MSDVWRILVVESEEALNHTIVNSLRKDGYIVQGVMNGADAIHILWSEEYDVVLCDLKAPGADGFELLQWLRASHPTTRMILIGSPDSSDRHMQALEAGAVGYLEKPLDMYMLKEELRRLLQQTGFSANLDSFDLLDVIQIITMSRESIALLVNTGLEELGLLCFKGGDLVWAEYGILRGEEAFFALAAHKNGTVTQQMWNEQVTANVTQPLSRLIFQALQYRTKYANQQPYSSDQASVSDTLQFNEESGSSNALLMAGEEDDTPFGVLGDSLPHDGPFTAPEGQQESNPFDVPFAATGRQQKSNPSTLNATREWWERNNATAASNSEDGISIASKHLPAAIEAVPTIAIDGHALAESTMMPSVYKDVGGPRNDLPSWLTDQPTAATPQIRSSMLSNSASIPVVRPSAPEWQPAQPANSSAALLSGASSGMRPITTLAKLATGAQNSLASPQNLPTSDTEVGRGNVAEWQIPEPTFNIPLPEGDIQMPALVSASGVTSFPDTKQESGASPTIKRNYNYPALFSALQSLGYSIPGFIAAALVDRDGQLIAQVAVDELDISRICKHFGTILKGTLQTLDQGMWGDFEDTVITSSDRYILMRVLGNERSMFLVLITTREAKPAGSLEVMVNVESAINAALRS